MARIRTTKPEIWTSEQFVECSASARLLFIGMWTFCDDGGVHPAALMRLKMEVFPADPFTKEDMTEWMGELIEVGLVREYEAQGKSWWWVTGWDKHQRIDRPTYRFPRPLDAPLPSPLGDLDEPSPPDRNGKESKGNGKESKGKKGGGGSRKRFTPPSVEEVRAYCSEKNYTFDPEEFVSFYASKGWKVGDQPMKSWKDACTTWHKRTPKQPEKPKPVWQR